MIREKHERKKDRDAYVRSDSDVVGASGCIHDKSLSVAFILMCRSGLIYRSVSIFRARL